MEEETMNTRSSISLESEIAELRSELEEKEQLLHRAGEIGKNLLEENHDLNKQLETLQNDFASTTEELKQERHSLQMRLDRKTQLEQNYIDENDTLKSSLKKQREEFEQLRSAEHSTKIAEMKRLVDSLQASLENSQLVESQMREKNGRLEEHLKETQEQLQHKVNMMNETCSQEIAELLGEVSNLQAEKMALQSELSDVRDLSERLSRKVDAFQQQNELKEAEVQEQACLATSYYNALEKCREEVQELNVQLDILKMETQDHKKKGNSIFAELDDKRQDAEKKLITQTVQLETLKKKYEYNQQHLHKLRMQMAALLQMSCSQADSSHLERLKTQLARARGEIDTLTDKVQKYDKLEKSRTDQMMEVSKAFNGHVDKNYVEYLGTLLRNKEAEVEKSKQELQTVRMLNFSEKNKVVELDRKVYSLEVACEKHRNEAIKLALKLEEYKLKYEPETCKKSSSREAKKFRAEVIPGFKKPEDNGGVKQETVQPTRPGKVLAEKVDNVSSKPLENIDRKLSKPLNSIRGKSVRMSDEVTVINSSLTECSSADNSVFMDEEEQEVSENVKQGRGRGRKQHHKVIQAPTAQDEGTGECATQ